MPGIDNSYLQQQLGHSSLNTKAIYLWARPYRNTPFSKKGKQLIELTEKDYVNTYEGDISMIDKWAEFLGLSKWYDWVGFEDVPLDYLNSV